jgi:hypothetical protein
LVLTIIWKLFENAVLGWGDDQIAALFGIKAPSATTVVSWAIPFLLAGATLWIYHLVHQRWFASQSRPDDHIYPPTVTQSPPPLWTPLITVKRWAAEAGWSIALSNNCYEFTQRLRQAGVRKVLDFEGRLYRNVDWPEDSKGEEPLVPIPAKHFENFQIDPPRFHGEERNYFILTSQAGKDWHQLKGQIYRDLHVDTAQIQRWLKGDGKPPVRRNT